VQLSLTTWSLLWLDIFIFKFSIFHFWLSLFIDTFQTLCTFEAETFLGQFWVWWFCPPQYKYKSSLYRQSFSFYDRFLNLEESICIGPNIDALIDACFHRIIASALYGPCVERCSYWCLNNRLSHCTACIMAFVTINGLYKFKTKSLTSSCNLHQNALIGAFLS
jgi:hypothetical protein